MKKSLLFGGALLWGLCTFGQSTVVSWDFNDDPAGTSTLNADEFNANNSAAQFQFTSNLTHWLENNAGQNYANDDTDKAVVLDNWMYDQDRSWMVSADTKGCSGLKINFSMFCPRNKPAPAAWQVHYKVGDGSWSYLGMIQMGASAWKDLEYSLPDVCDDQELISVRVMPTGQQVPFTVAMTPAPTPDSRVKVDNVILTASVSTSLGDQLSQDDVVVYPVPVMDVLYVSLPANARGQKVEVFNLVGSIVYQQAISGSGKIEVDLQSLATGSYILKVITDAGSVIKKLQIK